jgi:hypothetical protein
MAMRQRSGGVTATLPRQSTSLLHEDFQPRSERKEEAAATVILVHLPGVFNIIPFNSSINSFVNLIRCFFLQLLFF